MFSFQGCSFIPRCQTCRLTSADRSSCYEVTNGLYNKLRKDTFSSKCKKANVERYYDINDEAKLLTKRSNIDDRLERFTKSEALITLKDLKSNFCDNLTSRLLNPEWYNTSILNKQATLRVHFGENYENAFWNGKYCSFGDGYTNFYPFTDADIVGHELAHGFTYQHSELLYFDESGSMNEAFSDMTGEVNEAYIDKTDWLVGFNIIKDEEALRFMADPSLDNKSISHVDNFTKQMDPHHGSGIYNFMFYYIVHELKMDIKEAYRVFLIANEIYWHPHSDFTSGACDVLKVAYDLGQDLTPFIKTYELVGIKPCDVEKHIRGLPFNKTVSGITVSEKANPVFDFVYPSWAGNITITATSMCGEVHIKVSKSNMLTEGDGSDPVTLLAEGTSELNLGKPDGHNFFVKLSPESTENLENVSIRVTYGCDPYFVVE
ncbi:hemagglutinin/proteinase-like [Octopus bimaculoides]|uniref:hemagglutinin/proteinase-like n=1 Tax=Octopus bimaculoides TaxID=37653 RepID=UPI0022E39796|nr:hemagglutinin/proteinase-like [Octopus bimaculoides]